MASILDFITKYIIDQFQATKKKKRFNLHFDSHFISCSYYEENRMLSDRFEFSTHKLCKNKWVKNYTRKFREKNHV